VFPELGGFKTKREKRDKLLTGEKKKIQTPSKTKNPTTRGVCEEVREMGNAKEWVAVDPKQEQGRAKGSGGGSLKEKLSEENELRKKRTCPK